MRLPRRRISDDELERWLDTGRPQRVERMLDDPDVLARLESITELPAHLSDAIEFCVAPVDGFAQRTAVGVQRRIADVDRIGAMFGLLGLGIDTWRVLGDTPPER